MIFVKRLIKSASQLRNRVYRADCIAGSLGDGDNIAHQIIKGML